MTDTSLDEIANVAEQVADDQRRVARQARSMQREHDRGKPWSKILDENRAPGILDLMRRSRQLLASTATALTVVLARELSAEGYTRRRIAQQLGVTHQRVTTLLHRHSSTDG